MPRMTMRTATLAVIAGAGLALGTVAPSTISVSWADPPGGFEHGKGHDRGGDEHGPRAEHDPAAEHGRAAEHDHDAGHGREAHRGDDRRDGGHHFQDRDRTAVRDYFEHREHEGRCPPGLARRGNGCVPPGHARAWTVGAPLPRGVVYYNLPPSLVVQLTPPPAGYRYVRVASDVLMIAAGTGMVAEAIEDLGR